MSYPITDTNTAAARIRNLVASHSPDCNKDDCQLFRYFKIELKVEDLREVLGMLPNLPECHQEMALLSIRSASSLIDETVKSELMHALAAFSTHQKTMPRLVFTVVKDVFYLLGVKLINLSDMNSFIQKIVASDETVSRNVTNIIGSKLKYLSKDLPDTGFGELEDNLKRYVVSQDDVTRSYGALNVICHMLEGGKVNETIEWKAFVLRYYNRIILLAEKSRKIHLELLFRLLVQLKITRESILSDNAVDRKLIQFCKKCKTVAKMDAVKQSKQIDSSIFPVIEVEKFMIELKKNNKRRRKC